MVPPAVVLVAEDLADVDLVAVEPDAPGRVPAGLVEVAFVFAPLEPPDGRRALVDSRTPASAVELRAGMLAVVCRRVFDVAAATRSLAGFTAAAAGPAGPAGGKTSADERRFPAAPAARPTPISPAGRAEPAGGGAAGDRGANRPSGPRTEAAGAGREEAAPADREARRAFAVVWSPLDRSSAAARGSAEPFVAFAIT